MLSNKQELFMGKTLNGWHCDIYFIVLYSMLMAISRFFLIEIVSFKSILFITPLLSLNMFIFFLNIRYDLPYRIIGFIFNSRIIK